MRSMRGTRTGAVLTLAFLVAALAGSPSRAMAAETYENPLLAQIPGDGVVESCADPSTIYAEGTWYTYCTTDPLNDAETASGSPTFHKIPMLSSPDLVSWTYRGDAFEVTPDWAEPTAGMWAPEIEVIGGTYYLFYGITDVKPEISGTAAACEADNAIGYATGPTPLGPWTDSGEPLIGPRSNGAPGDCNFFWTYDPEVIDTNGESAGGLLIYYGSYYGGIHAEPIAPDDEGVLQPTGGSTQIAIPNRYEGAEVAYRDGFWYLFVSAANCCNGPLTGYSMFVGRSTSPLGPFVDREGVSFLAGRVGGTPFLSMNGNRWVGPGHNTVFTDFDGQWWTIYHAIDRHDPYYEGAVGFTKRPMLLDPIDWVDGWPTARGGRWASDEPMPAPAAQPGETTSYSPTFVAIDVPGDRQGYASDEFTSPNLHPRWEWVREPDASTYGIEDGTFRFDTQAADLFVDSNNASVLVTDAPKGDYIVETKMRTDLPAGTECCPNFSQAGLVIYGDDDNFLKLVHVSIWETRQTEFAKELAPVPDGFPRYGNTVVGPPGEWTWLRIAKRTVGAEEHYTAYTSRDGESWERGGTWTHDLGEGQQIGLVSMGGSGFTAWFDYVETSKLE